MQDLLIYGCVICMHLYECVYVDVDEYIYACVCACIFMDVFICKCRYGWEKNSLIYFF
jgi:hypothetical protein